MRSRSTLAKMEAAAIEAEKRVTVDDGPLRQIAVQAQGVDQQMVAPGLSWITASSMPLVKPDKY